MQDTNELKCEILRMVRRSGCVVRLTETGAIIEVDLDSPLDITKACMVCATHPIKAKITLGRMRNQVMENCTLKDIEWPSPMNFPPPARYQRKQRTT
jgi:hypothetical protein